MPGKHFGKDCVTLQGTRIFASLIVVLSVCNSVFESGRFFWHLEADSVFAGAIPPYVADYPTA